MSQWEYCEIYKRFSKRHKKPNGKEVEEFNFVAINFSSGYPELDGFLKSKLVIPDYDIKVDYNRVTNGRIEIRNFIARLGLQGWELVQFDPNVEEYNKYYGTESIALLKRKKSIIESFFSDT